MKKFVFNLIILFVCLAGMAAAAFWPAAAPDADPVFCSAESEFRPGDVLNVLLTDSDTGESRYYCVSADCTYRQLFALAGADDDCNVYDPEQNVSFADAVRIGSEYFLYIIL